MAMTDQRPRETHLATTRYVNTSRTATSAIRAAAVAAGIVTASVAVPMATPPIAAHAAPASAVQSLASLDGQICKLGSARDLAARAAEGALDEAAERLLLQRELVNRAGEQQLREFCEKDAANAELVDWLMGDLSALRHYILGGKVHTNRQNAAALPADYIQSLGILRDLRKAYGGDLTGTDADVFLRMMIAASLDVSGRARLWTGDPGFVSDPLVRYNMIKVFRADSRYRFQHDDRRLARRFGSRAPVDGRPGFRIRSARALQHDQGLSRGQPISLPEGALRRTAGRNHALCVREPDPRRGARPSTDCRSKPCAMCSRTRSQTRSSPGWPTTRCIAIPTPSMRTVV